jgi:aspartyl-tRNA(Asn)/glutamyl-tRNA(Gln) amidotransferase subunit B
MEQDTGKTTTTQSTTIDDKTITTSQIDYNRAGCALIEIVSHPDLRSAHEAAGAVEKIRRLLRHVGTCDGRMEMGSLRCDLNVSIAPLEEDFESSKVFDVVGYLGEMRDNRSTLPFKTGQRVEIKNLNSLRQIIAATEYEALRQSKSYLDGDPTGRETRTFLVKPVSLHPLGGETISIRKKGDAVDYRFMPEPELPPLILDGETLGYDEDDISLNDHIRDIMPESLEDAATRLSINYGLGDDTIGVITGDPPAIALLDKSVAVAREEIMKHDKCNSVEDVLGSIPTLAANLLCNDLFALVKRSALEGNEVHASDNADDIQNSLNHAISVEYSTVDGERLGSLVAMLVNESITTAMAKKILTIMYKDDLVSTPDEIAKANKFEVISNMDELVQLCKSVVRDPNYSKQLEQYKQGGKNLWKLEKFFVGKIMGQSNGNAHPEKMKEALKLVLEQL